MFNIESKFILNSTVENRTSNESDDLILTGIASTTKEPSLYGEIMTEDALQQMCEQAINLPILESHDGKGLDKVIGVIINAYVKDNDLHIDFKILSNHRERIEELLNNGVPIGLSIGAQGMIDVDTQQVIGITLLEVSLTPVPANRVAHNTVRVKEDYYTGDCLHGICYAMIKDNLNMEDNNMAEEEKKVNPKVDVKGEDSLTIDKVKNMLDERFAEEKEVLVATVVEEVKTELKKLNGKVEETFKIEDAVKEDKKKAKGESEEEEEKPKAGASEDNSESEEKPEEEGEGEGGASKEEEEDDKKKKDKKKVKESAPVIDEDKLINSITERILNSLGEKRDVTGTKTEEALKNDSTTEVEEAKPFTSEEAAKLIINDMNRKDPLTRAINEAINQ